MPVTGTAVASVAAPIVGGIIGNIASAGDRAKAKAAAEEAMSIIDSIGAPPDLSREILLEKFQQVGILTPKLESEINLGISQVSQVTEDPKLKDAQMQALQILQQRGSTGLGPEDRAALNQIRQEVSRDVQGKQQQILQNMQARGMGGSGAELAAQLSASQEGAERASAESDRQAATASERALQAITQAGQLGGQVRGQDFDVNKTKAAAQDEVARFNVANAVARQTRNIGSENQASAANLSEAQRVRDANTAQANAEKQRQVEAQRQQWLDSLAGAQARSGARSGLQNLYSQQAAQTQQGYSQMGQGAGAGAGAASGALAKK